MGDRMGRSCVARRYKIEGKCGMTWYLFYGSVQLTKVSLLGGNHLVLDERQWPNGNRSVPTRITSSMGDTLD